MISTFKNNNNNKTEINIQFYFDSEIKFVLTDKIIENHVVVTFLKLYNGNPNMR